MKAALYGRVSTTTQVEEGFSISAQTNLLTEYCKKNNIEIYKIYMDEGISGQKENRPEFQQMIKDAEKKLFDIILVHKFDRFARKIELSQRIKNQLKKAGINVISITEPIEDSPMGFFVSGLHDLMAEYFVRNLAQETKKGHVERARQGYHNGSIPYGYKIENEEMVINPDQAKVVKLIFDMYINKGYGSTKIARILNENGIKPAVSGQWGHFTVNYILKNYKYIGKIYYDGQVYDGRHDPIIDEKTFDLTRRYMKERTWKREYRGINYSKFLLLGLLRCGECGKIFRVQKNTKSKMKRTTSLYYYLCNNSTHYDNTNRCTFRRCFSVEKLENSIIDSLKNIMSGIKIDCAIKKNNPEYDFFAEREKKIEDELSRAKQAYLSSVFELNEYSEIKSRLTNELEEIKNKSYNNENNFEELSAKIKTLWDKFESIKTIPERKALLKEFIECIYIYKDNKICINFIL